MGTSKRPHQEADRCFVWFEEGGVLHGRQVDGRGDEREQAARGWLAMLRNPSCAPLLGDDTVFHVLADGRRYTLTLPALRAWVDVQGGSPREAALKAELRAALNASVSGGGPGS
jgi:hypothetical protein